MNTIGDGNIDIPSMPIAKPKSKFAGCDVFEVDSDTYMSCRCGKYPYQRWEKFFDLSNETNLGIKNYATKNNKKDIILKDSVSGGMIYLRKK